MFIHICVFLFAIKVRLLKFRQDLPCFLTKHFIINELCFSRPHVTPPLRPPIDLT